MKKKYDIIVIGGGHAGIEACNVCSNLGKKTLLITNNIFDIGKISCNPSIGGIGKSHIVKEIDILGGFMGINADINCTFGKILNESKGYAVRSTREQIDKYKYSECSIKHLSKKKNISILQENVNDIIIKNNKAIGVVISNNFKIYSSIVIITTGTFVNCRLFNGVEKENLCRDKEKYNSRVFCNLNNYIPEPKKFKTGTPPRIDKRTISYNKTIEQENNNNTFFSYFIKKKVGKHLPCFQTKTSFKTRDLILNNLRRSSLFSGLIKNPGPRYCPSIEDKYIRFKHNKTHNIFLETESRLTNEVYLNGLSNSFDRCFQKKILRTINGLEHSKIIKFGYAIEYSYYNPKNLNICLESKYLENLFLAGQINGTTGYEEAACQGLIAGINASLKIENKEPFVLDRHTSYIGVLIDDITNKGLDEPYRMFTSRAENRINIREDNVIERLLDISFKYNLINYKNFSKLKKINIKLKKTIRKIGKKKILFKKKHTTVCKILQSSLIGIEYFIKKKIVRINVKRKFLNYINAEIKYKVFKSRLEKEKKIIMKNLNNFKIPEKFNFKKIKGLSNEIKYKLNKKKIKTIGDIEKLPSTTKTDIFYIKNFFLKFFINEYKNIK